MHPTLAFLSWTLADLANHLWQSSLIALALLLLMALCGRLPARTRLALGWMALGKFALPFGIFAAVVSLLGGDPDRWPVSRLIPAPFALSARIAAAPAAAPDSTRGTPLVPADSTPANQAPVATGTAAGPVHPAAGLTASQAVTWAWLAGFAGLQAWWIIGGRRLRQRLLADATEVSPAMRLHILAAAGKAGLKHLPRCLSVGHGGGPGLLGVRSPILTLPPRLEEHLTAAELESVLLHEFVHLQRRDPFWLAVHVSAVSALWFNPLAWMLSRWIRLETEKACDERVLDLTGRPDTYAQGILKVVHLALGLPEPRLLNVITPPVVSRVKNILRHDSRPARRGPRLAALTVGAALLALGGNIGSQAVAAISPAAAPSRPPAAQAATRIYLPIVLEAEPEAETAVTEASPPAQPAGFLPVAAVAIPGAQDTTVFRGPPGPAQSLPVAATGLDSDTVSVDLPEEEIRGVLRDIADVFQLNVAIPDALQGKTSLRLRNVTWRQIFTVVLDPVGYSFVEDGNLVRIHPKAAASATPAEAPRSVAARETLSVDFPNEDIRIVLRNVADLFELNIIIPETVQGKTSVTLTNVTWRQIFKSLLDPVNHTFVEEGKLIRIVPKTVPASSAIPDEVLPKFGSTPPQPLPEPPAAESVATGTATSPAGGTGPALANEPAAPQGSIPLPPSAQDGSSLPPKAQMPVSFIPEPANSRPAAVFASYVVPALPVADTPTASARANSPKVYSLREVGTLPVPTRQVSPVYPPALKRAGVEGTVMVAFVVQANGEVRDVRAVRSTDPLLAQAAVNAIKGWKFAPATKDGGAVATATELPVKFRLTEGGLQVGSAATFRPSARFAAAPAAAARAKEAAPKVYSVKELDVIPSPTLQVAPVYPADLKRTGVEGSVRVEFIVDQNGTVQDVHAPQSSDRRFEPVARAAVEKWEFRPGRLAGTPVSTAMSLTLNFHLGGNR
jgi:TonB family protein